MRLIIISPENLVPNEIDLVNKMLKIDSEFRFHFRKPSWSLDACRDYLLQIDETFYTRISIHQHYELGNELSGIDIHSRSNNRADQSGISTSFHSASEMNELHGNFTYFFCSPVFPSISKKGYSSNENWNITNCADQVKEKAVALGGMSVKNVSKAIKMGFKNFAFLGSIWESTNPIETFNEILEYAK